MAQRLARNWWALALRGVISIAFGVAAIVWSPVALEVLVIFFGAYLFVDGIFALAAALGGQAHGERWWALLVEGLFGIAIGVVTFVAPIATTLALVYLIAGWAVVTGIFEIVAAFALRRHITGELWLGLTGLLSVTFGVVLALAPLEGGLALVWLLGIYAIVFGLMLLALAFRLRSWSRQSPVAGPWTGGTRPTASV